jgi:hypothetical protein
MLIIEDLTVNVKCNNKSAVHVLYSQDIKSIKAYLHYAPFRLPKNLNVIVNNAPDVLLHR